MRRHPVKPISMAVTVLAVMSVFSGVTPALANTDITGTETAQQKADQRATAQKLDSNNIPQETDRIIVKFKDEQTKAKNAEKIVTETEAKTPELKDATIIKNKVAGDTSTIVVQNDKLLTKDEQAKVIQKIKENPAVESAEPSHIVKATADVMDASQISAFEGSRYYLDAANVPAAWSHSKGDNTVIAILDTGTTNHPYINDSLLPGYDFISDEYYGRDGQEGRDSDPSDTGTYDGYTPSNWHGTHVLGLAHSVAPNAKILPYRVLGRGGNGYIDDFADATAAAADHADVINLSMSWYSNTCPAVMVSAIKKARDKGVPVVVAAGNDGANAANYAPANCINAIVVGATTAWNTMTSYSNYGWPLDVVTNGGTVGSPIWSTYNWGTTTPAGAAFGTLNGTSMAAPQVTGIVALIKSKFKNASVEQIRSYLTNSGRTVEGYPFVDASRAVSLAMAASPTQHSPFSLRGAIGARYHADGATTYGAPTSHEFASEGGVIQIFSRNVSMYWSEKTGTHPVWFSGAIGAKYREGNYEHGYGFPTIDEQATGVDRGYYQSFSKSNGARYSLYWSPSTATHSIYTNGEIGYQFGLHSGLNGWGYPVTDEVSFWDGAKQIFTRGSKSTAVYWSAAYGAHALNAKGAIFDKWANSGDFKGYGKPMTDETTEARGGASAFFASDNGNQTAVYWSELAGTHAVNARGALYWYWKNKGYINAWGYPTNDERTEADGKVHLRFSSGAHLTWSASEGVRRVA